MGVAASLIAAACVQQKTAATTALLLMGKAVSADATGTTGVCAEFDRMFLDRMALRHVSAAALE